MTRVIAINNAKGGTGKTTTAMNLGAYLALLGQPTLLVDFDPQANASSGLGINLNQLNESVYQGIFGLTKPENLIKNLPIFNFQLIPANKHLSGALVELVEQPEREFFLKKFIEPLRSRYNFILIDLPPSLNLLTINGLTAADEVLIPLQCEYYSLEGLSQLLEIIDLIQQVLNPSLKVAGALLTMYDKREKLSREVNREVRRKFPYHVYETEIPRSVALAEAPSFQKPIVLFSPQSPGALAYEKLAREVINQTLNFTPLESPIP